MCAERAIGSCFCPLHGTRQPVPRLLPSINPPPVQLGNINADHVAQDIQDAKLAGIDGFSLNIGDPSQPFVLPVVTSLFAAAQAAGTFHLHISMDLYASGDAAGGHPGLYNALLKQFKDHPNYFHINAAPYVTTFSDGGLQNTDWFNWKVSIGTMYFCPNFDNTTGYTTGADGWWCVYL